VTYTVAIKKEMPQPFTLATVWLPKDIIPYGFGSRYLSPLIINQVRPSKTGPQLWLSFQDCYLFAEL
jgi:hypothetical protein